MMFVRFLLENRLHSFVAGAQNVVRLQPLNVCICSHFTSAVKLLCYNNMLGVVFPLAVACELIATVQNVKIYMTIIINYRVQIQYGLCG